MRNLEQYPITEDEIVQCLKELMDGLSYEKTGLVGDMRPVLLANAIRIILTSVPAQQTLDDERGRDLIDGGITAWIESFPTDAEIRNGIIEECIRAVAGVMRIDPQSAGGPIFDALRALSAVSSTKR